MAVSRLVTFRDAGEAVVIAGSVEGEGDLAGIEGVELFEDPERGLVVGGTDGVDEIGAAVGLLVAAVGAVVAVGVVVLVGFVVTGGSPLTAPLLSLLVGLDCPVSDVSRDTPLEESISCG